MTNNVTLDRHEFLCPVDEVVKAYSTSLDSGLTPLQVENLQSYYPRNEIEGEEGTPLLKILLKQLCNAMVLVLFIVMILSFTLKDWVEGGVVTFVIILNVSIGFFQEAKAERRMDALRTLSSPSATVLRDGKTSVIPNAEVVPGDIVFLKMGDTVPADVRLVEAMNLCCDEQSLTGESIPVNKITENNIVLPGTSILATDEGQVGIGDRINIAYATTSVQKGRGMGIIIRTGMDTEVGKIAASTTKKIRKPGRSMNARKYGGKQAMKGIILTSKDKIAKFLGLSEGTPLQMKLAKLAYTLFFTAIGLAIVVFAVNKFHIPAEVVIYATSLGIAIIPESLVAVLTITMVTAVNVMHKAQVVVRDLSAIEALGGVTNICSDKTGTLTQGAMIVRKVWLPSKHLYTVHDSQDSKNPTQGRVVHQLMDLPTKPNVARNLDEERSSTALRFDVPDSRLNMTRQDDIPEETPAELTLHLRTYLMASSLCNLSKVLKEPTTSQWQVTGEPTEIALHVFAKRFDIGKQTLLGQGWSQVAEFSFDSSIKRMSVIYNGPDNDDTIEDSLENSVIFTKGAVERILDRCTYISYGSERRPITDTDITVIMEQMSALASEGQRVLSIAYRIYPGRYTIEPSTDPEKDRAIREDIECDLTFLGLAGIYDPPRRETQSSITHCATAGIKVHMLTGDHPDTAKAIAKEVGIIPKDLSILPESTRKNIVFTATEFDKMTDAEVDALEELPLVIARCAPHTKTHMIEALRRRGAFMAMTGDGVNDAPSLSAADVGISMGSGSDVAKSASKIVLSDDKFNSIVSAIREGRRMFDNIQKFVLHLLTSNVGEVILLVAGLGFQDNTGYSVFPVSPIQILWINMLTSSFPALGLGREPAAANIMRKPPHNKEKGVFSKQIMIDMLVYGILMGTASILTFVIVVYGKYGGELGYDCNKKWSESCRPVFRARASVFAELTWLILLSAWEFKDLRRSLFSLDWNDKSWNSVFKNVYANKLLFYSVVIGILSVFPVVYIPGLNTKVFKHTGISWEWGVVIGFTIFFIAGIELWKLVKRRTGWLQDHPVKRGTYSQGESNFSAGVLGRTFSMVSFKSWKSADPHAEEKTSTSTSRF